MIAKLICRFRGHRRGKRLVPGPEDTLPAVNRFQCPRCGAIWTRQPRKVA